MIALDFVPHRALDDFTPPDLHAQCRAESANLVRAHAQLAESLAIHRQTVELESARKEREIVRLQAELEDANAKNQVLQVQLSQEVAACVACNLEVSALKEARKLNEEAHVQEVTVLSSAHVAQVAKERALIEAAHKEALDSHKRTWLRDTCDFAKKTSSFCTQLSAAQQAATAPSAQLATLQQTERQLRQQATSVYPLCCLATVCADCGRNWRDKQPASLVQVTDNADTDNAASANIPLNVEDNTNHNEQRPTVYTLNESVHDGAPSRTYDLYLPPRPNSYRACFPTSGVHFDYGASQSSDDLQRSAITTIEHIKLHERGIYIGSLEQWDWMSAEHIELLRQQVQDREARLSSAMHELQLAEACILKMRASTNEDKKALAEAGQVVERQCLELQQGQVKLQCATSELARQAGAFHKYTEASKHVCEDHLIIQNKLYRREKDYDRVEEELRAAKCALAEERQRHLEEIEHATQHSSNLENKLTVARSEITAIRDELACKICGSFTLATHAYIVFTPYPN
ncbi:hypothetical protein C8T65DRAFT_744885 [Cerioporus squamosus]|nr:hypothetical protein C8T65DRAFT_744885 [Cerioporus squamosus]